MGLFGGRDLCRGTCKDGSQCLNFVSDGEMYCRHHKGQKTDEEQKELERRRSKDNVKGLIAGIIFMVLVALLAAGG